MHCDNASLLLWARWGHCLRSAGPAAELIELARLPLEPQTPAPLQAHICRIMLYTRERCLPSAELGLENSIGTIVDYSRRLEGDYEVGKLGDVGKVIWFLLC